MPRLTSYADAAKREAETKPIRGRDPEVKPLGRRNQPWWRIMREENGDICICAGNEPLLRYRPDDTLLIYDVGYWSKASYNEVVTEVTGIQTETKNYAMWVHIDGGRYAIRPNPRRKYVNGEWVEPTETVPENIFKRVEQTAQGYTSIHRYHAWTYVNPPGLRVHHIKRKEMKALRQKYANFISYATAMESIRQDDPPGTKEYAEYFDVTWESYNGQVLRSWRSTGMPRSPYYKGFAHADAAKLVTFMASEDATDNYRAYLWLVAERGYRAPESATIADIIGRVLIMHHHAEVLQEREVFAGSQAKDRYAWAISPQD
jgi:hypothetical protein